MGGSSSVLLFIISDHNPTNKLCTMSMFIHINLLDEGTVVPGVNLIVFLFLLIKTTCCLWERRKKVYFKTTQI